MDDTMQQSNTVVLHWLFHLVALLIIGVLFVTNGRFEFPEKNVRPRVSPHRHGTAARHNAHSIAATAAEDNPVAANTGRRLMSSEKKVLITGITGMIGSAVAEVLHQQGGNEIHGLVRWRSSVHNLKKVLRHIHLHHGDIQDPHFMHRMIDEVRPDVIYHFAAQAYNGVSWDSPAYTLTANIIGTLNILEPLRVLKMTQCMLVVAGSSTEYGHTTSFWEGPIPETAPLIPVTPYGVSKVSTEMLVRQYFLNYKIPMVIVRFFVHVGTGHTENQAIQSFCLQVAEIEAGIRPPVIKVGNLDTARDITDIHDAAPVVVQLSTVGVPGEAYNMASQKAIKMQEVLDIILSVSKVPGIKVERDESRLRAYDEKVLLGDNTKVRNATGWVPAPNLKRTILDILNYWRGEVSIRYNLRFRSPRGQ